VAAFGLDEPYKVQQGRHRQPIAALVSSGPHRFAWLLVLGKCVLPSTSQHGCHCLGCSLLQEWCGSPVLHVDISHCFFDHLKCCSDVNYLLLTSFLSSASNDITRSNCCDTYLSVPQPCLTHVFLWDPLPS
jgi:hypothetical protein